MQYDNSLLFESYNQSLKDRKSSNRIVEDIDTTELESEQIEQTEQELQESDAGQYSEAFYDLIDYADVETLRNLCFSFVKWLSEKEVEEFARANDFFPEMTYDETEDSFDEDELIQKGLV